MVGALNENLTLPSRSRQPSKLPAKASGYAPKPVIRMPKRTPKKIVDERSDHRARVNAALAAAEASAESSLKAKGAVTAKHVVAALRSMGGVWPTQCRPNVAPDVKSPDVPGMCIGLAPDRSYAGCAIGKISRQCPALTKLVTAWVKQSLGDPEFRYGSVQINFNYRARKHIDMNNLGPSYICSLGDHEGGNLWTGDRGVLDCSGGRWKLFDGNTLHATEPFTGERFSFILFTPDAYNVLLPSIRDEARSLGFTAAASDGADEPYFQQVNAQEDAALCVCVCQGKGGERVLKGGH